MTPHVLSRSGLLLRLGIAAAAGAFIVFCVVLPAEYRYDPTGFGRVTGLLELTKPRVATPEVAAKAGDADTAEPVDPALAGFPEASGGMPTNRTANKSYEGVFHSDTVKIPMKPDGELEYKLKMKTGETVVYSWKVDRGLVYYDLHGQPEDPKKSQRYKEVQEATSANGALVAPFDGIHGWYFLNLTGEPLVVTLNVAGYYELYGYVK